jgi:hypothetical protein
MKNFTYKIEHDYGLAPNPFRGCCTLAVCKSSIRRNANLQIGSWVFGTGSAKLKNLNKLIYAMRVDETLTFNDYWNDPRFSYKKPVLNGSLPQLYGDNIYHQDLQTGSWIQENSAHSLVNGLVNDKHLNRDLGGKHVLVSHNFYYFGENAIDIPTEFQEFICTKSRDMAFVESVPAKKFLLWLDAKNYTKNILYGNPISWEKHL